MKKAFTLLELVISISVLSVIFVFSVGQYATVNATARTGKAKSDLKVVQDATSAYMASTEHVPVNDKGIGVPHEEFNLGEDEYLILNMELITNNQKLADGKTVRAFLGSVPTSSEYIKAKVKNEKRTKPSFIYVIDKNKNVYVAEAEKDEATGQYSRTRIYGTNGAEHHESRYNMNYSTDNLILDYIDTDLDLDGGATQPPTDGEDTENGGNGSSGGNGENGNGGNGSTGGGDENGSTPPVGSIPDKVTNLRAIDIRDTFVTLEWTAPINVPVKEYIVYKDGKEFTRVTDTKSTVDGLRVNTIYGFKVVAVGVDGEMSKTVSLNLRTVPVVYGIPDKVTNFRITNITDTTASLAWDAPTNVTIKEYIVYKDGKEHFRTKDVFCTVSNLQVNTIYGFKVVAVSMDDNVSKPMSLNLRTLKSVV